mgnify:FL=1
MKTKTYNGISTENNLLSDYETVQEQKPSNEADAKEITLFIVPIFTVLIIMISIYLGVF